MNAVSLKQDATIIKPGNFIVLLLRRLLMIRSQNGARPPLRLFLLLRLGWLQHHLYCRIENALDVLQIRGGRISLLVSYMLLHIQQRNGKKAVLVGSLSCIRCSMGRLFAFLVPLPTKVAIKEQKNDQDMAMQSTGVASTSLMLQ